MNLLKNSNKSYTIHESTFFGKAFSVSDVSSKMGEKFGIAIIVNGPFALALCFCILFHTYRKTS